jgi:hypothetical protein
MAIASMELIKSENMLLEDEFYAINLSSTTAKITKPPFLINTVSNGSSSVTNKNRLSSTAIKINNQSISSSHVKSFNDDQSTACSFIIKETPKERLNDQLSKISPNTSTNSPTNTKKDDSFRSRKMSQSLSSLNRISLNSLSMTSSNRPIRDNNFLKNVNKKLMKSNSSIDTLIFKSPVNDLAYSDTKKLDDRFVNNKLELKGKNWIQNNNILNSLGVNGLNDKNGFLFELSTESNPAYSPNSLFSSSGNNLTKNIRFF